MVSAAVKWAHPPRRDERTGSLARPGRSSAALYWPPIIRSQSAVGAARPLMPAAPPGATAALRVLWGAVHSRSEAVRVELDTRPPCEAIEDWCECLTAFDAIRSLASILNVELILPDELCRNAPRWCQR